MTPALLAGAVLAALTIVWLVALVARSRTGLRGRVVYSDTGAELEPPEPLVSHRYGLTGKPDYLVASRRGVVPVEVKSARCPASGHPHESHRLQLASYCLLVEDVLGERSPYGILRYRDRDVKVPFDRGLRRDLLAVLDAMRRSGAARDARRTHADAGRCARCALRDECGEAVRS